jgi:hypothetical protein
MSNLKYAALAGAATLALAACTQQPAAPVATPATTDSAAPATAAAPAKAKPAGLHQLTAQQIAEGRRGSHQSCRIAKVNGAPLSDAPIVVKREEPIKFSGWFLSANSKRTGIPASIRVVDLAGTTGFQAPVQRWVERLDVNAAHKGVDSGHAGFVQGMRLRAAAPGQYKVFMVFEEDGKRYRCDHDQIIELI